MSRKDIAHEIALDLLGADALDRHDYGYDDNALIAHVQKIILEHLEDYTFWCYILTSQIQFKGCLFTADALFVNISLMFMNKKFPLQKYPCDSLKFSDTFFVTAFPFFR